MEYMAEKYNLITSLLVCNYEIKMWKLTSHVDISVAFNIMKEANTKAHTYFLLNNFSYSTFHLYVDID